MRDTLLQSSDARIRALADQLADGNINVGDWEREMRDAIKILYGVQYVFGRGGLNAMQPEDWTRLGELVKQQHQFLGSFASDVAAGKLSVPKLRVRADLYVGS